MLIMEMTGEPQTTLNHTCGDTVETLDNVSNMVFQVTKARAGAPYKANMSACLITCETYAIRFAWGANATASFGHILAAAQSLKLTNHKQIKDFRFINETAGNNAVIHVTPEISFR